MSILSNFFNWIRSFFRTEPPVTPPPKPPQEDMPLESLKMRLLELHNQKRSEGRLSPLKPRTELSRAAQRHNDWMAKNNRLSHDEPGRGIGERVREEGYNWLWVGENIAMGYATPEAAVEGWMSSRGHRANIMNGRFTDVGFGVTKDEKNQWWWTANFGTEK